MTARRRGAESHPGRQARRMCENPRVTDAPVPPVRSGTQAVERALTVLRSVETGGGPLGITELAQQAKLTVSTAHRLARALVQGGLLIQDPHTERYQLGPALVVLGRTAEQRLGYNQALPELRELAGTTGESVNLGIRTGNEVHVVLDVASSQPLRFDQVPGTRVPLHVSAMGKCLLAHSENLDPDLSALGDLQRITDRTITDPSELRAELERIRERGWALNDEERNPGVRAIATPILPVSGSGVLGAIAVQGPSIRITDERLPELAGLLQQTARRVAPLLGVFPDRATPRTSALSR